MTVGGRKAVGISQRRTKEKARFQCVLYRRFDAHRFVSLLAEPRPSAAEVSSAVMEIDVELATMAERLVEALAKR